MVLFLTTEVIRYFIAAIPQAFGSFILFYQYLKLGYKHFFIAGLMYATLMLWEVLKGLAIFYFDYTLALFSCLIWISTTFGTALLYDIMNRESISTIKMMFISVFSTILVFTSLNPANYYFFFYGNGEPSIFIRDSLLLSVFSLILVIMILIVHLGIKFLLNAPKELKIWIYFANIGIFFQQIVAPVVTSARMNQTIPAFSDIFFGLGSLIMALVFFKQPKLAFLLPFKASKLAIIDIESSITLYYHVWNTKDVLIDENLFSGMVTALGNFVKEAVQKGSLKEIHLEESIMILKQSAQIPVIFVLLATKSTASLRSALNLFVDVFPKRYNEKFSIFKKTSDISVFDGTSKLIDECFPFIPYY